MFTNLHLQLFNDEWERYRLTYEGGRPFVERYLKKYSVHEDDADFLDRKEITYCPAFAASAIDEINNSIFARMPDVTRIIGNGTYSKTLLGLNLGVDFKSTSIDGFIGCQVLPELTTMGKVGVYVDMPTVVPNSLVGEPAIHPYFYIYRVEDIISWEYGEPGSGKEYTKLVLRDNYYKKDAVFGLIESLQERYRYLEVLDGIGIRVRFYSTDKSGVLREEVENEQLLELPRIPFVMFQLRHSLMKNVADYQIALMNIESTDINFARKANFPLYTEQTNYIQTLPNIPPEEEDSDRPGEHKVELGLKHGRRYPKGTDRPQFINPSPAPLEVSMKKGDKIKEDIRLLVHLNLTNLGNRQVSAESKQVDKQGLENGLSFISIVLEEGERKLATFWNMYENDKTEVVVSYPRHFDLRTDEDRRREADALGDLSHKIPSDLFKREIMKKIVETILGGRLQDTKLIEIYKQIDNAPSVTSDAKLVLADHEAGLVSDATASIIRGYKPDEVERAQKDHAERLKRINEAQGGVGGDARGVPDTQIDQVDPRMEKQGEQKRGVDKLENR